MWEKTNTVEALRLNVGSWLTVHTSDRMERYVSHQFLVNWGDFFTTTEMDCLVGVRDYFTWTTTYISRGTESLKYIWSEMMSVFKTKKNNFPTLILDLLNLFSSDVGWYKRHLRQKSTTHPLRKSSFTGHLLFPPHLTQIHIIPSPFSPVCLSAFSPFSVTSFPFFLRLSPISSSGVIVFLYLHIPVWPSSFPFLPLSALCCHIKVK